MACEAVKTGSKQHCLDTKCRRELDAIKRHGVMGKFYQKRPNRPKTQPMPEACSETPIFIGAVGESNPPEKVDFSRCFQCRSPFVYVVGQGDRNGRFCSARCQDVFDTGVYIVAGPGDGLDLRLASLSWPDSERHPVHPGMTASQYDATKRELRRKYPEWDEARIVEHIASILRGDRLPDAAPPVEITPIVSSPPIAPLVAVDSLDIPAFLQR
jgi:hypothetical protein